VSDATTVLFGLPGMLFGLPGVRVEGVERRADGIRVVEVVTDEPVAAACPSCGVVSTSVKQYAVTSPKDIPYGEGRIMLRWNNFRWRCREDYCKRKSFTEAISQAPARARSTVRLRVQMAKAVGDAARSVAEVAAAHGVSWPTAHRAFVAQAETVLTQPAPTPVLGIDEARRGQPRWQRCAQTGRWLRVDPWGTGFVDLAGDQGFLGQHEGRSGAAVVASLKARTPQFREGIEYVAIDPAAAYASAIRTPGLLPNAKLVVDHFHPIDRTNSGSGVCRAERSLVEGVGFMQQDRQGGAAWANSRGWSGTSARSGCRSGVGSSRPSRRVSLRNTVNVV